MDKRKAINQFWNGFGIPAYENGSVPKNEDAPYIAYTSVTAGFETVLTLTATIWYRSKSWAGVSAKAEEIAEAVGEGNRVIPVDNGYLRIFQPLNSPFSQPRDDPSDNMLRGLYIILGAEFLTTH